MPQQENILGTMPIDKLVIGMSWPIMLSMLTQAVYNLVDSIFVARISDEAFLALSYAYPVQMLMVAFCVGTGVGFNALLARRLGEQRKEEAGQVAMHGFLLYGLCWLLFLVFGLFAAGAYLRTCTDSPSVIRQGTDYLAICCCWSFGMCIQFPTERVLQSAGHPKGFMLVQGLGSIINLVLDPILIFGLDMGVAGAAAATVAGQIISGLVGIWLVWRIRDQLPVPVRSFRFHSATLLDMCRIAAPATLMQSLSSVMTFGLNLIFGLWSETAVWVLGVYYKLQSFVFMPIFSINNGLVSIISYNYGAKDRDRVSGAVRFGLLTAGGTAVLGAVLLSLCASPILRLCFHAGPGALAMGVPALRMTALCFPFAAVSVIFCSALQSLGRSTHSLWVSLLRQILLLLPCAYGLVQLCPNWSFLSFLAAEACSMLAAIALYRSLHRTCISTL